MIIDFHAHCWEGKGDIKDFLLHMDKYNIDISVIHAIDEPGYSSNEYVASLIKQYPDRLMGFASVHPHERFAAKRLRSLLDTYGFKGLKFHPPLQSFSMSDPTLYPLVEVCIDYDIPVLFHSGPINSQNHHSCYGDPGPVDELAIRYPEAKIVIAHGDPFSVTPNLICKHKNVYMDTTNTFARYVKMLPTVATMCYDRMRKDDRIIFGTDHNPQREWRLPTNLDPIFDLKKKGLITQEQEDKIMYKTAQKLLKLD